MINNEEYGERLTALFAIIESPVPVGPLHVDRVSQARLERGIERWEQARNHTLEAQERIRADWASRDLEKERHSRAKQHSKELTADQSPNSLRTVICEKNLQGHKLELVERCSSSFSYGNPRMILTSLSIIPDGVALHCRHMITSTRTRSWRIPRRSEAVSWKWLRQGYRGTKGSGNSSIDVIWVVRRRWIRISRFQHICWSEMIIEAKP